MPIAAIQPEVGFNTLVSRPSLPVKVTQYGNLAAANLGSGSQFTHPVRIFSFPFLQSQFLSQCLHA